jgi:uncharacterized protein YaiI (UPF0178 family)
MRCVDILNRSHALSIIFIQFLFDTLSLLVIVIEKLPPSPWTLIKHEISFVVCSQYVDAESCSIADSTSVIASLLRYNMLVTSNFVQAYREADMQRKDSLNPEKDKGDTGNECTQKSIDGQSTTRTTKQQQQQQQQQQQSPKQKSEYSMHYAVAGSMSGIVQKTIVQPLDLVKTRMQVLEYTLSELKVATFFFLSHHSLQIFNPSTSQPSLPPPPQVQDGKSGQMAYTGLRHAFTSIVQREGFAALYTGTPICILFRKWMHRRGSAMSHQWHIDPAAELTAQIFTYYRFWRIFE